MPGGEYGLPPLNDDERKLAAALRTEERTYPPAVECECPDWLFAKIGDPLLLKALNEPAGARFPCLPRQPGRSSPSAGKRRF